MTKGSPHQPIPPALGRPKQCHAPSDMNTQVKLNAKGVPYRSEIAMPQIVINCHLRKSLTPVLVVPRGACFTLSSFPRTCLLLARLPAYTCTLRPLPLGQDAEI